MNASHVYSLLTQPDIMLAILMYSNDKVGCGQLPRGSARLRKAPQASGLVNRVDPDHEE